MQSSEPNQPDIPIAVTTAVVAFVIVNLLIGYKLDWAVLPFVFGVLLGELLWIGNSVVIRKYLTPQKFSESNRQKRALMVFALVKYPLVALIVWASVRLGESRQIMALVAGYLVLQVVIVLRMMGKYAVQFRSR